MRTRAAVALSIAGILITGSAALAVNSQTLSNSNSGTTGDANTVLLPDNSATGTPFPAQAPAPTDSPGTSATVEASVSPEPGDDKGGLPSTALGDQGVGPATVPPDAGIVPVPVQPGTVPVPVPVPVPAQPGDDKGGLRATPEPGDDSGGHGGGSGGGSSDD
jgi:hypothetical protein